MALLFAATPEATRQTTIVLINAIGSILYGPILAAFLLGMLTGWAGPRVTKIGIMAGAMGNLSLFFLQWWGQVISISWLWWNLTGFLATLVIARVISTGEEKGAKEVSLEPEESSRINWPAVYGVLGPNGRRFGAVSESRVMKWRPLPLGY